MTNWDRKRADALAYAIDRHVKERPHYGEDNELLQVVREALGEASKTTDTASIDLHRYHSVVCAVCRGSGLYDCDVDHGLSHNCTFLSANTSHFGDFEATQILDAAPSAIADGMEL